MRYGLGQPAQWRNSLENRLSEWTPEKINGWMDRAYERIYLNYRLAMAARRIEVDAAEVRRLLSQSLECGR